ncbi:23S rRNA (guanosine(2251)-2'-O)-methyltransferase RlmB [Methylohalomonas lacus]|nr:23S rRNA (guanosine(2251)-2'-O)-methyltransferase RlmB [Methylohalomonas lacus]
MAKHDLVYGIHAVHHLLERAPEQILEAWVQESQQSESLKSLLAQLREYGVAVHRANAVTLDKLSGNAVHQGIVLRSRRPAQDPLGLDELLTTSAQPLFLVLDGVQDPHNLGACLRSAAAAGATAVIIPKDRAVGINQTVRKVASGGAEIVPLLRVTNLGRTLADMKDAGVWLVGLSAEASDSIHAIDLDRPLALVMGAEGRGLRRLTREHCDYLANIPMAGAIDSLNVSVATGICLFEALRQRGG